LVSCDFQAGLFAFRAAFLFQALNFFAGCDFCVCGLASGVAAAVVFLQKKKPEKTVFLLPLWLLPRYCKQYTYAKNGYLLFSHSQNVHDDMIWALALAIAQSEVPTDIGVAMLLHSDKAKPLSSTLSRDFRLFSI
jgi:hypothetical protein